MLPYMAYMDPMGIYNWFISYMVIAHKKKKTPELLRPTADPPGVVCTGEACSEACRGVGDSDAGITELEQNFTKIRRPKKLGQLPSGNLLHSY